MSVRAVTFILVALAVTTQAVDVKYSELVAGGHVIDMGIKLSFTNTDNPEATEYNGGKPCALDDDACQAPEFTSDDDAKFIVSLTLPEKLNTLKKVKENTLSAPTTITVKMCYGKPWTVDRKWRKIKDVIDDDKRCKNKIINKMPLSEAVDSVITKEYTLPTDTAKAQWFLTAYLNCDVDGKDDTAVCGVDTTGGLGVLAKTADIEKIDGAPDAATALKAPTSQQIYFATDVRDSRPAGLIVASIIMSVLSVSLLVGFFVWEQITKKNK